ncbi:Ni/Fe hydrogenase subunit gamma, partial [Acidithiobacillus ferridurans]|nr:Ni/Fe hydrogenase subunit gamma [Acidithiobacillus ferridurans]
LGKGARLGLRGPYGRGWPLKPAEGRDIVLLTGGLGCAPVVSVIHYILRRRERFGRLTILQGVKHTDDLIWRDQYEAWSRLPDVQVGLAADVGSPGW